MNSALLLLAFTAAQVNVGYTYWDVIEPINYRWDTPVPAGTPTFWDDATHPMTALQLSRLQDRACVVWNRVAPSDTDRCRSTGTTAANDTPSGWNLSNGVDGILFHTGSAAGGNTYCNWNQFFPPFPHANECDYWLNANDLWRTYAVEQNNNPVNEIKFTEQARLGNTGGLDIYSVMMHETGHSLGLFHVVNAANFPIDCPANTYDCPMMTQRPDRVSWWPTIDDWRALRAYSSTSAKQVEFSIWDINSAGTPINKSSWQPLMTGGGGFQYVADTSPRMDCAPDPIANGNNSCVMAISRPEGFPLFVTLDVGSTTVSGDAYAEANRYGGLAVDVAYGDYGKFMAVGKRPVDVTSPAQIILYEGTAGSTSTPSSTTLSNSFTHGEPRITYHEPSCTFITSWVERDAIPKICSWYVDGSFIDCVLLPNSPTVWPVETICDAHLAGQINSCRTYVHQLGNDTPSRNGSFVSYEITVDPGDTPFSCFDTTGNMGNLTLVSNTPTPGTFVSSLIVDGTSYGSGREAGQYDGNLFFMTEDRVAPSITANTIRVRLDAAGTFNPPDVSIDAPMDDTGAGDLANLTSWAWHEGRARFIAIRIAKDEGT